MVRKSAAEIRAEDSRAWRDLVLALIPMGERFLEALRPRAGEAERLLALLLAELPTIKSALSAHQAALPPPEYVQTIVEIAKAGNVSLTVGPIRVEVPR